MGRNVDEQQLLNEMAAREMQAIDPAHVTKQLEQGVEYVHGGDNFKALADAMNVTIAATKALAPEPLLNYGIDEPSV